MEIPEASLKIIKFRERLDLDGYSVVPHESRKGPVPHKNWKLFDKSESCFFSFDLKVRKSG